MSCVLLVEDNKQIAEGNKFFLAREGYEVLIAGTLLEARILLEKHTPHVLVLDILLPDGSGLDFLKELRLHSDIPVLLLTSLATSEDMVRGLAQGGDDYLPKPYDMQVFLARVAALLRRAKTMPEKLQKGPLQLDLLAQAAYLYGEDLLLSPKQFTLLLLLLRHEGEILSSQYLYETVWKQPMGKDQNALYKQLSRIKQKLLPGCGVSLNVWRGEGYSLEIS